MWSSAWAKGSRKRSALAVLEPEPLAVPALEPAALDLEADDRRADPGEHEVDLAVVRALGVVARHPADGVECLPRVVEAVAERVEDPLLAFALDLGLDQRPGMHHGHPRVLHHEGSRAH